MKRKLTLVAVLLCVLCALCMVGCKNNAADDTGSGTGGVIENWTVVYGDWNDTTKTDFDEKATGASSKVTYKISTNPGTFDWLQIDRNSSGHWDFAKLIFQTETITKDLSTSKISIAGGNRFGFNYADGKIVFYFQNHRVQTADDGNVKNLNLVMINSEMKYLYY